MTSEWLKPGEVAALLKVSVGTLANWRYQHVGPRYIKLTDAPNGPVRYRREDLDAYLGEQIGAAA